jgi:hypothetical protein
MKKLLALVLCVMMFVAVIPTAAFAATTVTPVAADLPVAGTSEWPGTAVSKKAISNAKDNIERVYGTLAADTAVFGTIKSVDSVITDIAKNLFKDVDSWTYPVTTYSMVHGTPVTTTNDVTIYNSTLVDNTKTLLRDVIGSSITTYMNKHIGDFATASSYLATDEDCQNVLSDTHYTTLDGDAILSDGNDFYVYDALTKQYYKSANTQTLLALTQTNTADLVAHQDIAAVDNIFQKGYLKYDPIKYVNAYAAAVNDAFTSEKGAKGLESYVYALYAAKANKEVSDKLDDLRIDILDWDGSDDKLGQYGFNYSWNPYSFVNPDNTLKATADISGILHPDYSSVAEPSVVDPWYVFIP